jgi:hypothetical protein
MKAIALLASIGLAALAGCGYSPSIASGRLMCSPMGACPDGYWCDGLTCQKGQAPGDGGPPRDGSGDAISVNPADKFVGTWTFGSTVTRAIACTDGSSSTMIVGDYFVVAAGTSAPLTADYYCLWNLDLASTGTTTVIRSNTSCTKQDSTVTPPSRIPGTVRPSRSRPRTAIPARSMRNCRTTTRAAPGPARARCTSRVP